MTLLPSLDKLRVDQAKIVDYLLSEANSRGKSKFFLGLGFRPENWTALAEAIKAHARNNPVAAAIDSAWGTRYSIDGEMNTPDKREPRPKVRTVWIIDAGSAEPRLITAYPLQEAS